MLKSMGDTHTHGKKSKIDYTNQEFIKQQFFTFAIYENSILWTHSPLSVWQAHLSRIKSMRCRAQLSSGTSSDKCTGSRLSNGASEEGSM